MGDVKVRNIPDEYLAEIRFRAKRESRSLEGMLRHIIISWFQTPPTKDGMENADSVEWVEVISPAEFVKRYPGVKVPEAYFIAVTEFETRVNPVTGNHEIIMRGKTVGDSFNVSIEHAVPFAGPAPSQHEEGA